MKHTAKKMVYFIMLLVFISSVCADKIYIFNFHYKDGAITLADRRVDYGNVPDRLIQPENGYRAELIDTYGEKIESFRFAAPNEMFVDYSDSEGLHGGIMILNETDFALVTPYYEELDKINFYNKRNYLVSTAVVEEDKLAPSNLIYVYLSLGMLAVVIGIILWKRSSEK